MSNLVRLLVRETLIQESESPLVRAANEGYAILHSSKNSTGLNELKLGGALQRPASSSGIAIIYSPELLFESIQYSKSIFDIRKSISRSIGMNRCIVRAAVSYGGSGVAPCWGSSVVKYSVAASTPSNMPKVGPAAYEAAMWYSKNHMLAPDRGSVSNKAEKVWDRYLARSNNNGVTSKVFDDINNPQTPDYDDDCHVYQGKDSINRAYRLQSKPEGLETLEKNHQKCLDELKEKYDNDTYEFDETSLITSLRSLSIVLFDSEYLD